MACFYETISGDLNIFFTLALRQIFWKTKTVFKNLVYRFLVESTKIENAAFPYKTAILKAYVKANKVVSTKWTHLKEWSFFPVTILFFFKILFQLRTSYKELI